MHTEVNQLVSAYIETATSWGLDSPPLGGADRNLVLSPGQRALAP